MADDTKPVGNAEALATLLELTPDSCEVWNPSEFSAILDHQLAAPMGVALSPFSADADRFHLQSCNSIGPPTLGDLLHHPQPPVDCCD